MNTEITFWEALDVFDHSLFWKKLENIDMIVKDKQDEYRQHLDNMILLNEKRPEGMSQQAYSALKGKALENLVHFLLNNSGNVYTIYRNLHTCTNEIDDFVELNAKGLTCFKHGQLDFKGTSFLCECKNYQGTVDVTYVGKFCHLLQASGKRLGVLFSVHGITGEDWKDASGLIKKFHLLKEDPQQRYYVIDFNMKDFKEILYGQTFYKIIKAKCRALETDTSYLSFLVPHPAEANL